MATDITRKARELRERQTQAESLLWSVLRAKQLCGLKFRRQHPIPPFIADFACHDRHVIVEIDGGYHDYQYEDDMSRKKYLEDQGWMLIRFDNEDVLKDLEAVAVSIAQQLGLKAEFGRRKPAWTGMYASTDARTPSPGPAARPLPEGEVTERE